MSDERKKFILRIVRRGSRGCFNGFCGVEIDLVGKGPVVPLFGNWHDPESAEANGRLMIMKIAHLGISDELAWRQHLAIEQRKRTALYKLSRLQASRRSMPDAEERTAHVASAVSFFNRLPDRIEEDDEDGTQTE